MRICNVLKTLNIDDNTAIVVEGDRELFWNGMGILDELGKPYEVLSVGMDDNSNMSDDMVDKFSLLINGMFSSSKIYIQRKKNV